MALNTWHEIPIDEETFRFRFTGALLEVEGYDFEAQRIADVITGEVNAACHFFEVLEALLLEDPTETNLENLIATITPKKGKYISDSSFQDHAPGSPPSHALFLALTVGKWELMYTLIAHKNTHPLTLALAYRLSRDHAWLSKELMQRKGDRATLIGTEFRRLLAGNPKTPEWIIKSMLDDDDEEVRMKVLSHPVFSYEELLGS